MIILFRPVDCSWSAEVEAALEEMVIAHKVITVDESQKSEFLPPDTALPALQDNGQIITGQADIAQHLKELERFVAEWRRFQSDACYIDDDGEVC